MRYNEHHLSFSQLKLTLDALMDAQASFTDIGDSVSRVEQLLKELKQQEEKGQVSRANHPSTRERKQHWTGNVINSMD